MRKRNAWHGGRRAAAAGLGLALAMLMAAPAQADRLGSSWQGCEYDDPSTPRFDCSWKFEWRRQRANSNRFNGYWYHRQHGRFQGQITISLSGTRVTVSRPALGGGPPCTYTGRYEPRDVTQGRPARVTGTYQCGSYRGPWRAVIN